jgi:hypothetical protein
LYAIIAMYTSIKVCKSKPWYILSEPRESKV